MVGINAGKGRRVWVAIHSMQRMKVGGLNMEARFKY